MNDQAYKFNCLAEHFPQKIKELAESKNLKVGELRKLIHEGIYYIDDNCELCENQINKAFYDFYLAIKKFHPTANEMNKRLTAVFKVK